MTYRVLPLDEWEKIFRICDANQKVRPVYGLAEIVVAEDQGQVQGFAILRLAPFLEPVWVADQHRGSTLWASLVARTKALCKTGTIVYTTRDKVTDRVAKLLGFPTRRILYEGTV